MNTTKHFRLVVLFTILAILAGVAIIPYQMELMKDAYETALSGTSVPLQVVLLIGVLQTALFVFVASFVGLKFGEKVGLDAPIFRAWLYKSPVPPLSLRWILLGIIGSAIGTIAIVWLDKAVFAPYIPQFDEAKSIAWWKGLLAIFYGGVVEETLARLLFMTLFVWLFVKMFKLSRERIPSYVFWTSIVLAALLFGAMHLPATSAALGHLTTVVILRALILNGLLGILFGYLYWKKGLEYAFISHLFADIFLHVL